MTFERIYGHNETEIAAAAQRHCSCCERRDRMRQERWYAYSWWRAKIQQITTFGCFNGWIILKPIASWKRNSVMCYYEMLSCIEREYLFHSTTFHSRCLCVCVCECEFIFSLFLHFHLLYTKRNGSKQLTLSIVLFLGVGSSGSCLALSTVNVETPAKLFFWI